MYFIRKQWLKTVVHVLLLYGNRKEERLFGTKECTRFYLFPFCKSKTILFKLSLLQTAVLADPRFLINCIVVFLVDVGNEGIGNGIQEPTHTCSSKNNK